MSVPNDVGASHDPERDGDANDSSATVSIDTSDTDSSSCPTMPDDVPGELRIHLPPTTAVENTGNINGDTSSETIEKKEASANGKRLHGSLSKISNEICGVHTDSDSNSSGDDFECCVKRHFHRYVERDRVDEMRGTWKRTFKKCGSCFKTVQYWMEHHTVQLKSIPVQLLQAAAACSAVEFSCLLTQGFNREWVDAIGNKSNVIHFAAQNGNLKIVKILLRLGLCVDRKDNSGRTPLHYACQSERNNFKMILYLIRKGADINLKDRSIGSTPLHLAASQGSPANVRTLLQQNAWCSPLDRYGEVPFSCAVNFGRLRHVKAFCESGVVPGVNARENEMQNAIDGRDMDMVQYLISRNAPLLTNRRPVSHGMTVANMAFLKREVRTSERYTVVRLANMLLKAGYHITSHELVYITDSEESLSSACSGEEDNDKELRLHVYEYATNVKPLQDLCVFKVRVLLGTALPFCIEELPVPGVIKDLIKLRHIVG